MHRFRTALTSLFVVGLSGCASLSYTPVTYRLEQVSAERTTGGTTHAVRLESPLVAADSLLRITWSPQRTQMEFVLENLAPGSMTVVWDNAAFVMPDGTNSRVMHKGIRFMEREAAQPPTVVVRGGKLDELVGPTSSVSYSTSGGWSSSPLFYPAALAKNQTPDVVQAHQGKQVKVLLPVEVGGQRHEYLFTFEVKDVTVGTGSGTR